MATITITNTSSVNSVWLTDLYQMLSPVGTVASKGHVSVTTTRALSDLPKMADLMAKVHAGTVTLSVVPTSDEIANIGIAQPAVASTDLRAGVLCIHKSVTAGAGGAPDDVTIYAVNTVPGKFRIIDAMMLVSTAVGSSTVKLYTAASAGGTELVDFSSTSTGRVNCTMPTNATHVVTPASNVGLFAHRSDSGVAGEILVWVRQEQ